MNLINTKRQTKSHKEKEVSETGVPHYLPSLTLSPSHRFILEKNWSQISTYSFSLYGRLSSNIEKVRRDGCLFLIMVSLTTERQKPVWWLYLACITRCPEHSRQCWIITLLLLHSDHVHLAVSTNITVVLSWSGTLKSRLEV